MWSSSFRQSRWPKLLRCASDVGLALGQATPSAGLPQLPVKTLGRLLAQPGALNSVDLEAAVSLAMAQVEHMDGKDCIRVLGALAQVSQKPEPAALQSLGVQLSERLGDISTSDMAGLAENLAVVSAPVAPVFARLSFAFSKRVSVANPRQLTQVASAFARARLADRRLMPRLAQGALKQLHLFSPQDLSAFMSSFAALGLCHEPLLTGSAKVVVQLGPRLSAMDLALVAFSYAQFFLVFPSVVSLLQERLPSCAHELPKDRLAELTVSCARLEVRPKELLATFARNLDLVSLSDELFHGKLFQQVFFWHTDARTAAHGEFIICSIVECDLRSFNMNAISLVVWAPLQQFQVWSSVQVLVLTGPGFISQHPATAGTGVPETTGSTQPEFGRWSCEHWKSLVATGYLGMPGWCSR